MQEFDPVTRPPKEWSSLVSCNCPEFSTSGRRKEKQPFFLNRLHGMAGNAVGSNFLQNVLDDNETLGTDMQKSSVFVDVNHGRISTF